MVYSKEFQQEWNNAMRIVFDWAAHNGLVALVETDETMDRRWDPVFVNVVVQPKADSIGITMARPTVAQLMIRRHEDPDGRELLPPQIEVRLTRHGREGADSVSISPYELERFTLEAHHIDRIG